jgi:hypothetical protein
MFHRTIRLTALMLTLATAVQAADKPVISLTMHYAQARDRMIVAGFRPFRVIPQDSDLFRKNFAFREDIGRRFPEAARCEPKEASCYFLFVRGPAEIVAITTMGTHPEALVVRKVNGVTAQEAGEIYRPGVAPEPARNPPIKGDFGN